MMRKLISGLAILFVMTSTVCPTTTATFYADRYHNRIAADGSRFDQNKLTAASNYYKLGETLRVRNKSNGKSVDVKVTDRMDRKYGKHRIDLSKRAFRAIADLNQGVVEVEIKRL